MTKPSDALLATLALLALAASARAAEPPARATPAPALANYFDQADKNGDGRLSEKEAKAAGFFSRSSFADRFSVLIGAAPLHYQTRWRLLLANEMLKRPDTRVSDIARRIGYDSDAAFSRAFKAQFGHPPAMAKRVEM